MKTKLQILLLLVLIFGSTYVPSVKASTERDAPIVTSEAPSTVYLQEAKRSLGNNTTTSASASAYEGLLDAANSWKDPFLPGDESSDPGNVGAPIGDFSLPIAISILLLYLLYRRTTISRRRNF